MFDVISQSESLPSNHKRGKEMMNDGMTLVVKLPLVDLPELREKMVSSLNEFMTETVTKLILGSIKIDFPLVNAEELKEKTSKAVNNMIVEDVSKQVRQLITIDQDHQNIFAQ